MSKTGLVVTDLLTGEVLHATTYDIGHASALNIVNTQVREGSQVNRVDASDVSDVIMLMWTQANWYYTKSHVVIGIAYASGTIDGSPVDQLDLVFRVVGEGPHPGGTVRYTFNGTNSDMKYLKTDTAAFPNTWRYTVHQNSEHPGDNMIERIEPDKTLAYELQLLADKKNEEATTEGKSWKLFNFISVQARAMASDLGLYTIPHLGTMLHIHSRDPLLKGLIESDVVQATLPKLRESGFAVKACHVAKLTDEEMGYEHHYQIAWNEPTKLYHEN